MPFDPRPLDGQILAATDSSAPDEDDRVRAIGATEMQMYEELSLLAGRPAENLKQRFSLPSYSVAHISAGDRRGSSSASSFGLDPLPLPDPS